MIIDGRAIATRILGEVALRTEALPQPPTLLAIAVAPDAATRSYLSIKTKQAERAGIRMRVDELPEATTDSLLSVIASAPEDAIIVQLPLPAHVDTDAVLAAIPPTKDADVLSPATRSLGELLPPVVAAVAEAFSAGGVGVAGKHATVVGQGRLVGEPVSTWLRAQGAVVTAVTKEDGDITAALADADIIVTGAGVPGLITPDRIRPGVAVIDAGTSEQGGAIVGDADPRVAETASVFTPVPGGIGPIAVACLLRNIVTLAERQEA